MNNPPSTRSIIQVNEQEFQEQVLRSEQPVLVEFWAPWSRACQMLNPTIDQVAQALSGEAKVVRVYADASLGLSVCFDIHSVPTLLCFLNGEPRLRIVGTATKEEILTCLKPLGLKAAIHHPTPTE